MIILKNDSIFDKFLQLKGLLLVGFVKISGIVSRDFRFRPGMHSKARAEAGLPDHAGPQPALWTLSGWAWQAAKERIGKERHGQETANSHRTGVYKQI